MYSLLFETGLCSWKHTSIECQTFRSYFPYHSENLDKIFTLGDCPYKFSEINVLSELKMEQKLEINMLNKLFWKIASLKSSCSKKSVKCWSSRSELIFKIAVLKKFAIFTGKHLCWNFFLIKLQTWRPIQFCCHCCWSYTHCW